MLREYTVDELALLRANNQFSKIYLTILKPVSVYTARVNGTPVSYDKLASVEYDGAAGTLSDVKPGMSIRFGSAPGLRDHGEERIREDPDSNTFFFGESSELKMVDNDYITIVDDYRIWARHLRVTGGQTYMDYDIEFDDQNMDFNPVVIMGMHAIAWLEAASVDITFPDLANSWVLGSTISTYLTTCEGATVTDEDTDNPTVTFDAPGRYLVYSTVTAANGKSSTGVRYVYVHDDTDMPITDFELLEFTGDYDNGGFNIRVELHDASTVDIEEGALVILHSKNYYNGAEEHVGFDVGRENIEFIGRVANEAISINPLQGSAALAIQGLQEELKKVRSFPVGFEQVGYTPTKWVQLKELTVKKALFELVYWRSTAASVMDVYIEDDARYARELQALAQNIWSQIEEIASTSIFSIPGVDPYGRLFIEIEPQLVPEEDRDWPVIMEITKADYMPPIDFGRNTETQCSLVDLSGVSVTSNNVASAFFSLSQGHVFAHFGEPQFFDHLLLSSQSQSNRLAGLMYGFLNREIDLIPIRFAGNVRGFSMYPRQYGYIEIASGDNVRGVPYTGNLIPREISKEYDKSSGIWNIEINFEPETFEANSVNGDVPGGPSDVSKPPAFPPIDIPEYPIIIPGPPPSSENGPKGVLVHDSGAGLVYCDDFDAEDNGTHWETVNGGLTLAEAQSINWIEICPNGAIYVGFMDGSSGSWIARAPSIGSMFTKMVFPDDGYPKEATINPLVSEQIGFETFTPGDSVFKFHVGTAMSYSTGANITPENFWNAFSLTFGQNQWLHTNFGDFFRVNAAGTAVVASGGLAGSSQQKRASTTGIGYFAHADGLKRYEDSCDTVVLTDYHVTVVGLSSGIQYDSFGVDPTGRYLMAEHITELSGKGKSSDFGATWSAMGSLPFANHWCFQYAGQGEEGIRFVAGNATVYYTPDFGVTWINKTGHLNSTVVFPNINAVRVVKR